RSAAGAGASSGAERSPTRARGPGSSARMVAWFGRTMPAEATIRVADYALAERLGEGGSGHVYRATDPGGRHVAVKLLGPAAELDPDAARARFRREVEILRQLDHPALVTLLDHGLDDELGPFLVMPLVPGQ